MEWSIAQWRANVRVANVGDPRDCKPREECTPFTATFATPSPLPDGATWIPGEEGKRYAFADGRYGYSRMFART